MSHECDNFIPEDSRYYNFGKLSQLLGLDSSEEINGNLSKNVINDAANMYFALNTCPLFYEKLNFKAIYGTNTRTMAMILSNIIKKSRQDKTMKIFAKVSQILGFQHITFHHKGNNSLMLMKHVLTIKGKCVCLSVQNKFV